MNRSLLVRNCRLATKPDESGAIIAVDSCGIIRAAGNVSVPDNIEYHRVIDADGAIVFPGLIDTHVHLREPGMEHKGDIYSESRALLAGGITSFCDMPNTVPPTLSPVQVADKLMRSAMKSVCNYGFFIAASDDTASFLMPGPRLFPGIKLFMGSTTGALGAPSAEKLKELFEVFASLGIPVMVHAEDNDIIARNAAEAISRYGSKEQVPLSEHHNIRSAEACLRSTAEAVNLAHKYGTRLHIAHITTAAEVREFLTSGPVEDKLITAETTPLYLDPYLCDVSNRTWRHKVNPSIKTAHDREALLEAVLDGRIDTIGTDHAPHLSTEKQGGALTAASGAPGAQHALVRMLEYLNPTLIAEKMAKNPAKLFGIPMRGELKPGYVADITIVAPCKPYIIDDEQTVSGAGWTPFHGLQASHRITEVNVVSPSPLIFCPAL